MPYFTVRCKCIMNQWHPEDLRYLTFATASRETRMRIDTNSRSWKILMPTDVIKAKNSYLLSLGIHGEIVSMGIIHKLIRCLWIKRYLTLIVKDGMSYLTEMSFRWLSWVIKRYWSCASWWHWFLQCDDMRWKCC